MSKSSILDGEGDGVLGRSCWAVLVCRLLLRLHNAGDVWCWSAETVDSIRYSGNIEPRVDVLWRLYGGNL